MPHRGSRTVRVLLALCAAALFAVPFPVNAQIPFGGYIATYKPVCQTPPAIWMTGTFGSLMYTTGSFSFLMGPPKHSGEWLLGFFGGYLPCIIWVPCHFGMCPLIIGGGPFIIFHGSSG